MIVTLKFTGIEVGKVYATMGVASLFMPALSGIIADRWINAERVFGACHIIGAGLLMWASTVTDPGTRMVPCCLRSVKKYVVMSPLPLTLTLPRHWNS